MPCWAHFTFSSRRPRIYALRNSNAGISRQAYGIRFAPKNIFNKILTHPFKLLVPSHIRNIIFDLGGVILNLSVVSTLKQLATMAGMSLDQIKASYAAREEFI